MLPSARPAIHRLQKVRFKLFVLVCLLVTAHARPPKQDGVLRSSVLLLEAETALALRNVSSDQAWVTPIKP